ncbi:hypothetical protein AAVH_39008 [Aphelenchoides avenae]|nr:hypothetical protein AAVH_39008 [Aphelenchus avenae]
MGAADAVIIVAIIAFLIWLLFNREQAQAFVNQHLAGLTNKAAAESDTPTENASTARSPASRSPSSVSTARGSGSASIVSTARSPSTGSLRDGVRGGSQGITNTAASNDSAYLKPQLNQRSIRLQSP